MSDGEQSDATAPRPRRAYRGTVQAEIAALTARRIVEAGLVLFDERWLGDVTLEQVAQRAGVTVKTLLRHYGSKDQLFAAVSQHAFREAVEVYGDPPVGDLAALAHRLADFGERAGARLLRGVAQEERDPRMRAAIAQGRAFHRAWIERACAPFLADHEDRARLLAALAAVTDVYSWKLLRRDGDLGRDEAEHALLDLLEGLLIRR
jgi:AcrR family transcriptional regulator